MDLIKIGPDLKSPIVEPYAGALAYVRASYYHNYRDKTAVKIVRKSGGAWFCETRFAEMDSDGATRNPGWSQIIRTEDLIVLTIEESG